MQKKEKKTDYVALQSAFMRIPRMRIEVARDLLDLGLSEIYHLQGRSPETLYAELIKRKPDAPRDRLHYFRMAVYYAENDQPEAHKMNTSYWAENSM